MQVFVSMDDNEAVTTTKEKNYGYKLRFVAGPLISIIYYIDTSVLLENIPLVKFIKTTSGTRVVYFP